MSFAHIFHHPIFWSNHQTQFFHPTHTDTGRNSWARTKIPVEIHINGECAALEMYVSRLLSWVWGFCLCFPSLALSAYIHYLLLLFQQSTPENHTRSGRGRESERETHRVHTLISHLRCDVHTHTQTHCAMCMHLFVQWAREPFYMCALHRIRKTSRSWEREQE